MLYNLMDCLNTQGKLGEILLSLSYQPAVGRLNIIVMKCKDLKAKDITGASGNQHFRSYSNRGSNPEISFKKFLLRGILQ